MLVFEGGGAMGAFQCGAWQALAPFLRKNGHTLAAVAGASIGAVNAAMVARHYHDPDAGVGALKRFWSEDLASPPLPLVPIPDAYAQAWNGLLTGLVGGNPALYQPLYANWHPAAAPYRFFAALHSTAAAEQTMQRAVGVYQGSEPALLVCATDVKTGKPTSFSSIRQAVTPRMISASMAIPVLFSPVEIEGKYYWDGDFHGTTVLREALQVLRDDETERQTLERVLVIVVNMFSQETDRLPESTMEATYRLANILLGGKVASEAASIREVNDHLDFAERALEAARREPDSPLSQLVLGEYRQLLARKMARIELLNVSRDALPNEHISREFDFSPGRLSALMQQGYEQAMLAIDRAGSAYE